jgi:hypothetical protein
MSLQDFLPHLFGFLAPALFVSLGVVLVARLVTRARPALPWWAQFVINFLVGAAVLAAGLWHFGVDGKMATYSALVAAIATAQWLAGGRTIGS